MQEHVIITAALTGSVTPKEGNENIPLTPKEIAEDAYRCWKAGAAIVHVHVRDAEGKGTMDRELFAETIRLIRAYEDCDVIICGTSSGTLNGLSSEARMEHFKTIKDIELGSLDAGSFNWGARDVFDNNPEFLEELAACYLEHGIKPEIEIFDMGMIGNTKHYIEQGLLKNPVYCQLCLGILGGAPATVESLMHLKQHLPAGAIWSAFGIGKDHLPILYAALAMGAHGIRVGLEDNLYYARGKKATNLMLVERAVRIVTEFGKTPATPAQAREILGLEAFTK